MGWHGRGCYSAKSRSRSRISSHCNSSRCGEARGPPLQTHLAYGSMLSVWRRAPPASLLGPLVRPLWWLQPALAELANGPVGEVYCSLDGGEVDVLGHVVGPVVAAWLLLVGAAAEGDGFVAGCSGLQGVGAVVGAEVGVEPDALL